MLVGNVLTIGFWRLSIALNCPDNRYRRLLINRKLSRQMISAIVYELELSRHLISKTIF